ncbi:Protein FAM81B [Myotis brandtii]|uniref:Protein FAM81B n=1 Tax=Myotis brandtii TaxID=109478 RepID=S7PJK3_MYOBR|nr:Protein FAM81B [Myotis brandtii]
MDLGSNTQDCFPFGDTDINKSVSPTAEEQPDEPDGPLSGSTSDQENKVRLSPIKMSTKNSTDLVEYVDKGHSFLPVIPNTQRSQIEDKLHSQERTIAFLLQQAFRIKEDISACLQGTQGFQKEELLARKLLENHIQTITSIVKNLSQNIEILEEQIRVRDQAATGTNFTVQELNSRHLQGVGDLRGRVARCDASIVKLSGDIHFIRHEYRQIEKTIQELISSLETVSKNLDMKIIIVYQNAQSSDNCSKERFTSKGFKYDSSCPHTMSTVSSINKHLMSVPYVSPHPPIKAQKRSPGDTAKDALFASQEQFFQEPLDSELASQAPAELEKAMKELAEEEPHLVEQFQKLPGCWKSE